MHVLPTALPDVLEIAIDPLADERGMFARTFDRDFFESIGITHDWPQCNVSFNRHRATLRGMHFQADPHAEPKLVRCTAGRAHDVALDIRPASPTRGQWAAVELSAASRNALYIPAGFAHGFLTLEPDTEMFYHMGASYAAHAARGVRWNDPAFAIDWPMEPQVMAERDAGWPDFRL